MRIGEISLSICETPASTARFDLLETKLRNHRPGGAAASGGRAEVHLLQLQIDAAFTGVCTVGDTRYTTLSRADLEQLRVLVVEEDPRRRERLDAQLRAATRSDEYLPDGPWDEIGGKIGLLNPPRPSQGRSAPPAGPGWGGQWHWAPCERVRMATV